MCTEREIDADIRVRMPGGSFQMCSSKVAERVIADLAALLWPERTSQTRGLLGLIRCQAKGLGSLGVGLPSSIPLEDVVPQMENVLCRLPYHAYRLA